MVSEVPSEEESTVMLLFIPLTQAVYKRKEMCMYTSTGQLRLVCYVAIESYNLETLSNLDKLGIGRWSLSRDEGPAEVA